MRSAGLDRMRAWNSRLLHARKLFWLYFYEPDVVGSYAWVMIIEKNERWIEWNRVAPDETMRLRGSERLDRSGWLVSIYTYFKLDFGKPSAERQRYDGFSRPSDHRAQSQSRCCTRAECIYNRRIHFGIRFLCCVVMRWSIVSSEGYWDGGSGGKGVNNISENRCTCV